VFIEHVELQGRHPCSIRPQRVPHFASLRRKHPSFVAYSCMKCFHRMMGERNVLLFGIKLTVNDWHATKKDFYDSHATKTFM
jgi:hypothetical protein